MQRSELGPERLTLLALLNYANRDGECWPSQATIASLIGRTERTARQHLAALANAGWITRARRGRPGRRGGRSPDIYRLVKPIQPEVVNEIQPEAEIRLERSIQPEASFHNQRADTIPPRLEVEEMPTPPVSPPSPLAFESVPPKGLRVGGTEFDQFWAAYPRHVAKPKAREAWVKALAKECPECIIAAAAAYADDPNREDKYTCHPTTWLNQERWEDDPLPCRAAPSRQQIKNQQRETAIRSTAMQWLAEHENEAIEAGMR